MKSHSGIASHFYFSSIYRYGGETSQMLSESCQVVEEAEPLGDWLYVYWGYGFRAWAEGRLGKHEEAMQSMARAQAASQKLGGQLMGRDILAAVSAELSLAADRVEEALARAEEAVELAKEVGGVVSEGMAQRVWGQALARLAHREEAEKHLAESWRILLSGEVLLEAARTQVAWGLLCRDRGDLTAAH